MNTLPDGIVKVRDRIAKELDADVDIDQSEGLQRFTLWVVAPRFTQLTHLQRQDLVWSIIGQTCDREESMMISLVMAFAPGEMEEFVDSLGTKK